MQNQRYGCSCLLISETLKVFGKRHNDISLLTENIWENIANCHKYLIFINIKWATIFIINKIIIIKWNQLSSVAQSCLTLCYLMDCSTPGHPVHHQFLEPTKNHVHHINDAIQPSHPLLSPSPPTFNLSQHQGLFQWVSSSHHVAKVLEFQLQYQSFQWIFRTDFL